MLSFILPIDKRRGLSSSGTEGRGTCRLANSIERRKRHPCPSPLPSMGVRLCSLPSADFVRNAIDSGGNIFHLCPVGPNGCLVETSFLKCRAVRGGIGVPTCQGRICKNTLVVGPSDVMLSRAIVGTRLRGVGVSKSALMCGAKTFGASRKTILRSLIERLPKLRLSRGSNGVGFRKGRVARVLLGKGRFFTSDGITLGGVPMSTLGRMGMCRRRSSGRRVAKISSNGGGAIVSIGAGGSLASKLVKSISTLGNSKSVCKTGVDLGGFIKG